MLDSPEFSVVKKSVLFSGRMKLTLPWAPKNEFEISRSCVDVKGSERQADTLRPVTPARSAHEGI